MDKILRAFPRRVEAATPDDDGVRIGLPSLWDNANPPDQVLISVTFTKDKPLADTMAQTWSLICNNVQVGGPAYEDRGSTFVAGKFLRKGYIITSRGCPNNCWFCDAWKREGRKVRELPIVEGYNVLDNNLLACSQSHIEAVFRMLAFQHESPHFSGGFEAARLKQWHVDWLAILKPQVVWFAYDTPDDWDPLVAAAALLRNAGMMTGKHQSCCYVLAGWNQQGRVDTIEEADIRCRAVVKLGFFPQAMLMNDGWDWPPAERRMWKEWAYPWIKKDRVGAKMKEILGDLT